MSRPDGVNAVGRMLGVLGDEWTLLIAQQASLGVTRYGDFAARLPISHAVLTRRLRSMTDDGLLDRRTYQSKPPRSEYVLTRRGRSLWPVLTSIWEWERHWVPEHAEALPVMWHAACGTDFAPVLTCRHCDQAVTEKDVVAQWGPSGSWSRSMPIQTTRRRSDVAAGAAPRSDVAAGAAPRSDVAAGAAPRSDVAAGATGRAGLFDETMSILGNRWAFALLVSSFVGASRFTDFQDQLGAPPGSLADRLQIFMANGVLRSSDGGYALTEKGRAVFPILVTALQWAQRWFQAEEGAAVLLGHRGCGGEFDAVLTCDQCAERLRGSTVTAREWAGG